MRIAAVSYLNARPLLAGLERDHALALVPPVEVAARLADGRADLGLVPVIALARQPDLVQVGDAAITSPGPVDSVLLRLRTAPRDVRRLAIDPHSRTSQVLAQIVLTQAFAARPEVIEVDPAAAWATGDADAVLVIGDPALRLGALEPGEQRLDLASAWAAWTGVPFVFAVWAAPRAIAARAEDLSARLARARSEGLARLPTLISSGARELGLPEDRVSVYLHDRIRYFLGAPERAGLSRYLQLARECSLV